MSIYSKTLQRVKNIMFCRFDSWLSTELLYSETQMNFVLVILLHRYKKDTKPTRFWRVIWFTFEPRQLRIFAHKFVLKLNNVGAGLHSSVAFQRPQLLSIVGLTQSLFTASTDTDLLAMSRRLTRISQRPCNIYSTRGGYRPKYLGRACHSPPLPFPPLPP